MTYNQWLRAPKTLIRYKAKLYDIDIEGRTREEIALLLSKYEEYYR